MTPESKARREWARMMMRRATGNVPEYGSAAFLALPDGPERVASIIRAAECWARDGDELEERLAAEVAFERQAFLAAEKRAEDAAWVAMGNAHQERWKPITEVLGRRLLNRERGAA